LRSSTIFQSGEGDLGLLEASLREAVEATSDDSWCGVGDECIGSGGAGFPFPLSFTGIWRNGLLNASVSRRTLVGPIPGQFVSSAGEACTMREKD
jgi:hypothetical protein